MVSIWNFILIEKKLEGEFRVVQHNTNYKYFDEQKERLEDKCCKWITKSIKTGKWNNYDFNGKLIEHSNYYLDIESIPEYRQLTDKLTLLQLGQ